MDRYEYTTNEESLCDFFLRKYRPAAAVVEKFSSVNLLYDTLNFAKTDKRVFDFIQTIRQVFGISRTVWGVKFADQTMWWEFYFYDYRRRSRERSISRLLQALRPIVRSQIEPNENIPYFMFSVDVDNDLVSGKRDLDKIHLYISTPGFSDASGLSYSFSKDGRSLENVYFFFDPRTHLEHMKAKILCSAFIDPSHIDIRNILWPELLQCRTIGLANKQKSDCVYFSGITVDQFLLFLQRMNYPEKIICFIRENRSRLDHLLYDVGIDYKIEGNDMVVLKSGYYGIF